MGSTSFQFVAVFPHFAARCPHSPHHHLNFPSQSSPGAGKCNNFDNFKPMFGRSWSCFREEGGGSMKQISVRSSIKLLKFSFEFQFAFGELSSIAWKKFQPGRKNFFDKDKSYGKIINFPRLLDGKTGERGRRVVTDWGTIENAMGNLFFSFKDSEFSFHDIGSWIEASSWCILNGYNTSKWL